MRHLTLFIFLTLLLYSKDMYLLEYSPKNKSCTLKKNGVKIPLIDKRFEIDTIASGYTCSTIQKEQYNECHIVSKEGIKALAFSYGSYSNTNLIVSFKTPTIYSAATIEVSCTKKALVKKK